MRKSVLRRFNVLKCMILTIWLVVCFGQICFADEAKSTGVAVSQSTSDAISGLEGGNGVYGTILEIMGILFGVGIAVAVGKMMHIGIKFMTSTATKKSDAKDALLPWAIGTIALILFWSLSTWLIKILDSGNNKGIFDI